METVYAFCPIQDDLALNTDIRPDVVDHDRGYIWPVISQLLRTAVFVVP